MPTLDPNDLNIGDQLFSGYWKINSTNAANSKSYYMGTHVISGKNIVGVDSDDDIPIWQIGLPAMVRDNVTFYL